MGVQGNCVELLQFFCKSNFSGKKLFKKRKKKASVWTDLPRAPGEGPALILGLSTSSFLTSSHRNLGLQGSTPPPARRELRGCWHHMSSQHPAFPAPQRPCSKTPSPRPSARKLEEPACPLSGLCSNLCERHGVSHCWRSKEHFAGDTDPTPHVPPPSGYGQLN